MQGAFLLLAAVAVSLGLLLRLLYLLYVRSLNRGSFGALQRRADETCATAVFLGSGTLTSCFLLSCNLPGLFC